MKKNKKWVQIIILGIVLIIGVFTIVNNLTSADDKKYPVEGSKAPDFTLTGLDNKSYKLSDFKGKGVLINFWGTFCPPCKKEMPALQKQYDIWKDKNVEFLEVNLDTSRVTVQNFVDQYNLNLPILLDNEEKVRKQYGVVEYPTTFFVKPDGTVMKIHKGEMDEAFIADTLKKLTDGTGGGQ
ncbi:thiol-disulfide oxidoreductase [Paenibacillus chitinolyticus]|uniref:Thiol-disulfide oxidoreductase n=1 Tax=Paenibacillus chitinolyticus TaxID=79263 RepID=A0A410WVB6_9BACL|nr:thiol-disulfide oxidoreductase ResA [Paenibacillus chitinolyticus]MCY9589410.1 thiol-disulfide oxidoreductase ResA [Paenibacillus chitinolyticus]MCY9594483.1 thiol-disulfide oxidoreductase ResA [Paenibacillus chitinolyticus]QAV18270.1 thiol-disulfide oxidoreductase [Paenibacillus chitinolyticus]